MRQRFLRISGFRRSAVYLARALVCCCNAYSVLQLLLRRDHTAVWRCIQLLIILTQGGLALSLALAKDAPSAALEFGSVGILAPLAAHSAGRGFLLSEFMRLLLHVTLSWYPLESVNPGTCHIPSINILMQQAVHTAETAILDIPANKSMQSLLLMPAYCFLDWRYASLNGIPGSATLPQYLSRRGALMLLSKVLFSGIPALIMSSNNAQQVAVYAFCLPLLAVQCFVSSMRLFHGIDNVGMWEVWMATVVAFGIGTDIGHVVEELRAQFSKVRKIADDILPHHVVDTLMQQQRRHVGEEDEEDAEPPEQQRQPMEQQQPPGPQDVLPSAAAPRPLVRTSSASTVPPAAALPQLRSAVSMSHQSSAASPDARQQLFPSSSQPAAGGGGGKSQSRSAELPLVPFGARRAPARRSSALTTTDEAEYAEEHPGACILFADVCGFTTISEGTSPALIVNMLNKLFSKFDEIISEFPFLYKLDVIGDCYMVASGLHWHSEDPCPARSITDFAKLMLKTAATVLDPVTQQPLSMRCGIHKGPVVGALLGSVRRKYSIFGDVVNSASRLETTSRPGAIHVSAAIYQQLWRPSMCLDEQQPLELRSVEEDGEPEPGALEQTHAGRAPRTSSSSQVTHVPAVPVADSTRLTSGSGAGSASTWGSLRLHAAAAAEEAEGRCLAGMGLLAIGPLAGEEAAGQVDAAMPPVLVSAAAKDGGEAGRPRGAEQDHLASDQNDHPGGRSASLPTLGVTLVAAGTVRSLSEQQQHSSLAGGAAAPDGARAAVRDPTGAEELWQYRGRIDLKGRAALETYILQVI